MIPTATKSNIDRIISDLENLKNDPNATTDEKIKIDQAIEQAKAKKQEID